MNFIGPCTNHNWQSYWCLVNLTSPDKIYNPALDHWGECSLSCMFLKENPKMEKLPLLISYNFSPDLFSSMQIGSEINSKISFKGKISDFFIWEYPIGIEARTKFMFCEDTDEFSKAKGTIHEIIFEKSVISKLTGNLKTSLISSCNKHQDKQQN